METFYVTKKVRCKLKEEDQCFEVGDFNVTFYFDPYKGGDSNEYYMMQIQKFNGNSVIKENTLYVKKTEKETYPKMWEMLHDKSYLGFLLNKKKYTILV